MTLRRGEFFETHKVLTVRLKKTNKQKWYLEHIPTNQWQGRQFKSFEQIEHQGISRWLTRLWKDAQSLQWLLYIHQSSIYDHTQLISLNNKSYLTTGKEEGGSWLVRFKQAGALTPRAVSFAGRSCSSCSAPVCGPYQNSFSDKVERFKIGEKWKKSPQDCLFTFEHNSYPNFLSTFFPISLILLFSVIKWKYMFSGEYVHFLIVLLLRFLHSRPHTLWVLYLKAASRPISSPSAPQLLSYTSYKVLRKGLSIF